MFRAQGLAPSRLLLFPSIAIRPTGAASRDDAPRCRGAAGSRTDAARSVHATRLLADEVRLVRIKAARALAPVPIGTMPEAARPAFARAWEELLASERVAAERPESHVNIAGLLAQRGDDGSRPMSRATPIPMRSRCTGRAAWTMRWPCWRATRGIARA